MDKQEIFDKVRDHLLSQMKRSVVIFVDGDDSSRIESCAYRGPDGCKCAAGILIKDEFYNPSFNHAGITTNPSVRNALIKSGIDNKHFDLVKRLQDIHDIYDPPYWKAKLTKAAQDYNLIP